MNKLTKTELINGKEYNKYSYVKETVEEFLKYNKQFNYLTENIFKTGYKSEISIDVNKDICFYSLNNNTITAVIVLYYSKDIKKRINNSNN